MWWLSGLEVVYLTAPCVFTSQLCLVCVGFVGCPCALGVSFIPQSKDMCCRMSGISKLSAVCDCALWWHSKSPGIGFMFPASLCRISGLENGWFVIIWACYSILCRIISVLCVLFIPLHSPYFNLILRQSCLSAIFILQNYQSVPFLNKAQCWVLFFLLSSIFLPFSCPISFCAWKTDCNGIACQLFTHTGYIEDGYTPFYKRCHVQSTIWELSPGSQIE